MRSFGRIRIRILGSKITQITVHERNGADLINSYHDSRREIVERVSGIAS